MPIPESLGCGGLFVLLLVGYLVLSLRVVKEYERLVVFRLGRLVPVPKVLSPITVALPSSLRAPASISALDAEPPSTSTASGASVDLGSPSTVISSRSPEASLRM